MDQTRRLLQNLTKSVEIPAPALLFFRRTEQPASFRLALADIAQPIRKSNCCTERHPDIPSNICTRASLSSRSAKPTTVRSLICPAAVPALQYLLAHPAQAESRAKACLRKSIHKSCYGQLDPESP